MKLKLYLAALLFGVFALQSCDDDDDKRVRVPEAVKEAFAQKYPTTPAYEWDLERGFYVADFRNDYQDAEAWFKADGTWVKTETDYVTALPEVVQNYVTANYADYRIDDVDWVETPSQTYFDIELEKKGVPDVYLKIQEDGTVIQ